MLRHYLVNGWRDLVATPLQSAIALLSLAVGIAAVMLAIAIVRNQTTYDHFIPGYDRTYVHIHVYEPVNGVPQWYFDDSPQFGPTLKLASPEIEQVTLLCASEGVFRRGNVTDDERYFQADAKLFDVLPLPVYRGDPAAALARPDGAVLTRTMARKYFGTDDVLGKTILIQGHPWAVGAVIQDLPLSGTELEIGFNNHLGSPLRDLHAPVGAFTAGCAGNPARSFATYVRLRPGAKIDPVAARSPAIYRHIPEWNRAPYHFFWLPIDRVNLHPGFYPGAREKLLIAMFAAILILVLAVINFVNLTAARTARRAVEVGVRKLCGATRRDLIVQFIGETVFGAVLAGAVGLMLAEWLMPVVNALFGIQAELQYFKDPVQPALLLAVVFLAGFLGGAYPALALSSFKPVVALKGLWRGWGGAALLHTALVTAQFALLAMLAIGLVTVLVQRSFAVNTAPHARTGHTLIVRGACTTFREAVLALPQVAADQCTDVRFLASPGGDLEIPWRGSTVAVTLAHADSGIFTLYGINALAGSLEHHGNASGAVINETARLKFGFSSDAAALGQSLNVPPWDTGDAQRHIYQIRAVVPDFSFYSVQTPIRATLYVPLASLGNASAVYHNIRLRGGNDAAAALTIMGLADHLSHLKTVMGKNMPRYVFFMDDFIRANYQQMAQQGNMIAIFSIVGLILACIGLYGLSLSIATRRIKEIGIRKVMGAGNPAIVFLLLWQFAKPIIWGNLIAWPLAYWLMSRWLSGFAYHAQMPLWAFPAVGAATLFIGLATVGGQAALCARQKPVHALRYE